jgi:WD40 repeat protein
MSLVFSSDGKRLFAGTGKKKIYIFDQQPDDKWNHCQVLRCCSFLSSISSASDDTIDCFVLSSGDSFLIASCGNRMVRFVVDPSNKLFQYDGYRNTDAGLPGGVGFMALSSSGEYLVFSGRRDCCDIHIWKLNCGVGGRQMQALGRFPMLDIIGQDAVVICLGFGPDDQLAIGLDNGILCILDAMGSNGELVSCFTFETFKSWIFSVSWTPDSRILVGTGRGLFLRISEGILKRIETTEHGDSSYCWLLKLDSEQMHSYYGTYRGQTGQCVLAEDQLIAMGETSFPVAVGPHTDTFSDTIKSYSFTHGDPGTVRIGLACFRVPIFNIFRRNI